MGWVYNLENQNAPTAAPRLIAICLTFSTVALLAVFLRFYVRLKTKKGLWIDDYASLFSAVLGCGYAALAVVQTRYGQALDPAYFPPENAIGFSKVQYAGGPIYTLALLGFKIALLASYLRVGGFVVLYRIITYVVIALVTCNQVIFTFVLTLACDPVSKQWDPSQPGSCVDTVGSYYALAGTSLAFDVVIIILPLPVLWSLQLQRKQKLVLCGLFALGFFITAIQIIRMFTISNLKTYTDSQAIVEWSDIEISLGVIVTCVPTYGPLFAAFSSRVNSYRTRHREGSSYMLGSDPRRTEGSGYRNQNDSSRAASCRTWNYGIDEDEQTMRTVDITAQQHSEECLPYESKSQSDSSGGPIHVHTETAVRIETH